MATIEINHKTLRDIASKVADYCDAQNREMRLADVEIKSLLTSEWLGLDAQQFGQTWEGVDEEGSTTFKFRESLKKFGENLTACANEYQAAQEEAYNRATSLS